MWKIFLNLFYKIDNIALVMHMRLKLSYLFYSKYFFKCISSSFDFFFWHLIIIRKNSIKNKMRFFTRISLNVKSFANKNWLFHQIHSLISMISFFFFYEVFIETSNYFWHCFFYIACYLSIVENFWNEIFEKHDFIDWIFITTSTTKWLIFCVFRFEILKKMIVSIFFLKIIICCRNIENR